MIEKKQGKAGVFIRDSLDVSWLQNDRGRNKIGFGSYWSVPEGQAWCIRQECALQSVPGVHDLWGPRKRLKKAVVNIDSPRSISLSLGSVDGVGASFPPLRRFR